MKRARLLLLVAILALVAGCDHATKRVAADWLDERAVVTFAGDAVRFELAHNVGGFLSFGARLPPVLRGLFFQGLVPLALLAFCAIAWHGSAASLPRLVGLGLVAGGGIANWVDRLLHDGAVTDFVSLGVAGLRTGIFNVADVAILAGVALLLWPGRAGPAAEPAEESA